MVAVGWGLLNETDTKLPTLLQQVTVQIVDDEAATCKSANYDRRVQLCAGVSGGGKGSFVLFTIYKLVSLVRSFLIDQIHAKVTREVH